MPKYITLSDISTVTEFRLMAELTYRTANMRDEAFNMLNKLPMLVAADKGKMTTQYWYEPVDGNRGQLTFTYAVTLADAWSDDGVVDDLMDKLISVLTARNNENDLCTCPDQQWKTYKSSMRPGKDEGHFTPQQRNVLAGRLAVTGMPRALRTAMERDIACVMEGDEHLEMLVVHGEHWEYQQEGMGKWEKEKDGTLRFTFTDLYADEDSSGLGTFDEYQINWYDGCDELTSCGAGWVVYLKSQPAGAKSL